MSQFIFSNNVQTTLAAPISTTTQTVIEISSTANVPSSIPAGYYWELTLCDAATQSFFEIVYVTGVNGHNLTVLRGQENTTARTWNTNDLAYSCATAGVLASFMNASQAGGFVELNPPAQQNGSINVSGNITAGGVGHFSGLNAGGGPLNNVSDGQFSSYVVATNFIASFPYGNHGFSVLPIQLEGGASNLIGIGPTNGISYFGITGSALAIGAENTGLGLALDISGNLGLGGNLYAYAGFFQQQADAPLIYQNGTQVVDTIGSPQSTILITKSGGTIEIDVANNGVIQVGSTFVHDGNGGDPTIALPAYGQWFIEVIYAVTQITATNMNIVFSMVGGTMTGGFLNNANGYTGTNGNLWITLYGKGHTTVNNQTLTFALSISGGALDPSNQPWTVRATRTA